MAIQFPVNIDNLTKPGPDDDTAEQDHAGMHSDAIEAIQALEAKVGVDNSANPVSFDSRIDALEQNPGGGAVWYVGTGVPDNGTGNNGDLYLDDANGDVYQKAAGSYSVVANIRGSDAVGWTLASYYWHSKIVMPIELSTRFYADRDGTINWCRLERPAGNGGSTAQVDILLNGTSIYPSSTKPDLSASSYIGTERIPDTIVFAKGDYFQVDTISNGGGTGPLKVTINYGGTDAGFTGASFASQIKFENM